MRLKRIYSPLQSSTASYELCKPLSQAPLKFLKIHHFEVFFKLNAVKVKNKTSIIRFLPIDEKSFNFGREKCTNRNIFLYFDIFEKLLLKTAITCNREGGQG